MIRFIRGELVRRLLFGCVFTFMIGFSLSASANTEMDELILRSGQKITGHIIERSEVLVAIEVYGVPQTYFIGEITAINGARADELSAKNITPPPLGQVPPVVQKSPAVQKTPIVEISYAKLKTPPVVPRNDELDSLVRFMNIRNSKGSTQN